MKQQITALAISAALCAMGGKTPPTFADLVRDKQQTEQAAAPAGAENAATARDTTDVIDLDEADDSAEARANTPAVTATAQEGGATLVDIACDNATLEDVLRQFRKVTDANIISDDSTNLQRRVSVNLHRVPWLDGLQSILNSRNYRLEERGSIFFVKEDKVAEPILTKSFTLNHASAKELAELFNKSYGKKDAKGVVILPIATSFDGANVVVVTATETTLADCDAIIRAVDKAVAQIYIEARFLELSSEAMHKLGVQWNSLSSWGATASAKAGWENNYGTAASYSTASGPLVPTAVGEATGAGRSAASMGWRNASGFSGQLSADDFNLAMSAFESIGEGRMFSNPKVIVSNGKEANVDMTTKYPNVRLTSQRGSSDLTGAYQDFSAQLDEIRGDKEKGLFSGSCFFEWGITLKVTPRISPDGLITVEITPTISQLDYDVTHGGKDGFYSVRSDSTIGYFPIISMKRITTDFTMKDGSTAVIGGLTRTTEDDVDSGIPYLREIPWIGQKLFGWKSRQKVQKEIIVCVTIGIANPADLPKDVGLPKNAVLGREYIEGLKLEPGDRKGSAYEALKLDFRTLDEQEKMRAPTGTVTIKPAES